MKRSNHGPLDAIEASPLKRLWEQDELDSIEDELYEKRLAAIFWMRSRGIHIINESLKEERGLDDDC